MANPANPVHNADPGTIRPLRHAARRGAAAGLSRRGASFRVAFAPNSLQSGRYPPGVTALRPGGNRDRGGVRCRESRCPGERVRGQPESEHLRALHDRARDLAMPPPATLAFPERLRAGMRCAGPV